MSIVITSPYFLTVSLYPLSGKKSCGMLAYLPLPLGWFVHVHYNRALCQCM